ncbi:MAG: glycosyltransferase involved in cell wall biosynthesis [Urechidicola sp.]|jgi:glycosyltransferase involved in cell wall biosynthesis
MSKHLSKDRKLLVVSDTGMVQRNGKMFAFGPVVKELQEILVIFDSITWIGFNRPDQIENASYLEIPSEKINTILLKRVGGTSFLDKLKIITNYPVMWHIILSEIKKHQYIHVRAPSNPAYISMLLSKNYPEKQFWFKYAGSWIEKASFFYDLQRKRLKKYQENYKVTVNGNWKYQPKHIVAFENPCLNEEDRLEGEKIVMSKDLSSEINYCFVGGLNENKGVLKILSAFSEIEKANIGTLHIIGDGALKEALKEKALAIKNKVIIHGYISKQEIIELYKTCHFIILPSKSEGFPKVIGEAMNYSCVPIVSNVSCINQYIENKKNGFLIEPNTVVVLKKIILQSLSLSKKEYNEINRINYILAEKFTYANYNARISNELFKL